MITKEQALLAFCDHCDDRPIGCQDCPLREIVKEIPDTPCPFCENMKRDAVRAILKTWRKAEKELKSLDREYRTIVDEIDALRGLQAVKMDGMPHGNAVTHPTEDSAVAILDMLNAKRSRLGEIFRKIEADERLLDRIKFAMVLAKNADLLKRYYHDGVRPMEKVAEEFHVAKRTAWRMETEGIDSIADLIL